jgi:acyl-coenzyme A thioesterase PaaI-like protein
MAQITLTPAARALAERVSEGFARQRLMSMPGARLVYVGSGEAHIELTCRRDLKQQHGYLHAGIVTTVSDSACRYEAFTSIPQDVPVVSIEFKIDLLAPAEG